MQVNSLGDCGAEIERLRGRLDGILMRPAHVCLDPLLAATTRGQFVDVAYNEHRQVLEKHHSIKRLPVVTRRDQRRWASTMGSGRTSATSSWIGSTNGKR
jgi:hypothetical protein